MGTRAEFWIGKDCKKSIAWMRYDGYPFRKEGTITNTDLIFLIGHAKTETEFEEHVKNLGDTKKTNLYIVYDEKYYEAALEFMKYVDYTYAFEDGVVWVSHFGKPWEKYDVETNTLKLEE